MKASIASRSNKVTLGPAAIGVGKLGLVLTQRQSVEDEIWKLAHTLLARAKRVESSVIKAVMVWIIHVRTLRLKLKVT